MSGAHEGCSQGKSVREREGSKHSTAATLERVDSEAAVLPQDFEDTVHARQLKALCRRVGRRMSRQGPGCSPSIGLTHLNAARPREKVEWAPALHESSLSDLVSRSRATRPVPVTPREDCRSGDGFDRVAVRAGVGARTRSAREAIRLDACATVLSLSTPV